MIVEIKQLVIRAVAEPKREAAAAPIPTRPEAPAKVDTQDLVDQCVREVLRTLERQRRR